MSDTPETDAYQAQESMAHDWLWRNFARKLERERDKWKHNAKIVDEERKAERENAIDIFIELHELRHAVKILKTAKGRFHTEQAATKLFNLLP